MSKVFSFDFIESKAVPEGELLLVQDGEITGRIINIGIAAQDTKDETRHIHQQPQHKICPSCGQKLCIGEREECRCWCCEASWGTGKLRAGAA